MSFDAHRNFAVSTVAVAPSPPTSGLFFTANTGDGTLFPVPPFNVGISPDGAEPSATNTEIWRITDVTGDVLTGTRQAESSALRTVLVGDRVMAGITVKTVTDVEGAVTAEIARAESAEVAVQSAAATDATSKANAAQAAAIAASDPAGSAASAQAAAIAASQPVDTDLTAIAALSTTPFGRSLLTSADAAALRAAAALGTAATHAATDFDLAGAASAAQAASQPVDSDLTAIAALTTTSFGRSFLALADAAAGRTLLGLGTLATQSGTFSGTSSGSNTGDETSATILSKLSIATLSGSNTGDQTLPTTLPPNGAAGGDLAGTYPNPTLAAAPVLKSTVTTKGDLYVATGSGVVVRHAAGADGTVPIYDSTQTDGIRNSNIPRGQPFASGLFFAVPDVGSVSTASLTGPVVFQFIIDRAITLSQIGIEITTLLAASTVRLAILNDNNGVPGTVLIDAGTVSGAATGVQMITVSQAIGPGRYWGWVGPSSGSTLAVRATAVTGVAAGRTTASVPSAFSVGGYAVSGVSGSSAATNNPTVLDGAQTTARMILKVT